MDDSTEFHVPAQPDNFEKYADREVAAYQAHRRVYEAKNPPPVKPSIKTGDIWFRFIILSILNLASMTVSAPHTIPLFLESVPSFLILGVLDIRYAVGVAAFIMIEIALIALTYMRISQRSRNREEWQEGVAGSNRWTDMALLLVLTVALGANIYSTLNPAFQDRINPLDDESGITQLRSASKLETSEDNVLDQGVDLLVDGSRLLIFLLVGAAAPILLFFTGEASAIIWVQHSAGFKSELAEYDRKYILWNQGCVAAYRPAKMRELTGVQQQVRKPVHEVRKEPKQIKPIYIDKDRRQCPVCNKVMTRQSWQRHPHNTGNE